MSEVLITGITGFLGRALAERFIAKGWRVVGVSRNEYLQWRLQLGWQDKKIDVSKCKFCLADIADMSSISEAFRNLDFEGSPIIHTAALKHVDYAEFNKWEYIRVNEIGTKNVCKLADVHGSKVVFTSSDKVCYPQGNYGRTKGQGEGVVLDHGGVVVRMGNLIEAHGNLLEKIVKSNPHCQCRGMTRFFEHTDTMAYKIMSLMNKETGVYSIKSKVATIGDIFDALVGSFVETREFRPGEKMHEYLVTSSDRPVYEYDDYFFVGDMGTVDVLKKMKHGFEYCSKDCADRWTQEDIKKWLGEKRL